MKAITASEANRQFSSVLRQVAQGEVFTVISRGRSVASIQPISDLHLDRQKAKTSLVSRLGSQAINGSRKWTRNELYEGQ